MTLDFLFDKHYLIYIYKVDMYRFSNKATLNEIVILVKILNCMV